MAPMAASSMLARAAISSASAACRASRAAALASARAALSAAAAHRASAAAVSRAARSSTDASAAAAADLALGTTSSRESRSLRRRDASGGAAPSRLPLRSDVDSMHSDSCLFPDDKPQTPEFVADEKDLESDEALWALYERWCKHFNQERDRDEMARRFGEFKRVVLLVHRENNADRPYKLAINQFTDGKLSEVCLGGDNDAFHHEQLARIAKLHKTGSSSSFIWLNGKYYMEVPAEFQPE